MPDIVEVIKGQHREVEKLLAKAQEGGAGAAAALQQVSDLLMPHSEAEESFVYPAIRERQGEEADQVHDSVEEHKHIEGMLAELVAGDPDEAGWDGKLAAMVGELEHHVEEEEQDLLPVLEKEFSAAEREEMGARFVRETGAAVPTGGSGSTGGSDEPTKDELYDKAKEQDVPGRSTMTKDELKDAVED